MVWLVAIGVVALVLTAALTLPPSLALVTTLRALVDAAARENPERFHAQLEPMSPFVGSSFRHSRITGVLKADLSPFGERTRELQAQARKLDRRAHLGMIPLLLFALGAVIWWFGLR